jgi:hypothetical protein
MGIMKPDSSVSVDPLVFEWETTYFEVVIEQHQTSTSFRVDRSRQREVVIDLGKFSCAVIVYPATLRPRHSARLALATSLLAATLGFTLGMGAAKIVADTTGPPREALQPFTSG